MKLTKIKDAKNMKKPSGLIAVLLCFCLCVTAYATESVPSDNPEETTVSEEILPSEVQCRFMCDVAQTVQSQPQIQN